MERGGTKQKIRPTSIIIKEYLQQAALKGTISWRSQEKRKDRKSRKRSEEKVMGFSSASIFPSREREAITQGGNHGD